MPVFVFRWPGCVCDWVGIVCGVADDYHVWLEVVVDQREQGGFLFRVVASDACVDALDQDPISAESGLDALDKAGLDWDAIAEGVPVAEKQDPSSSLGELLDIDAFPAETVRIDVLVPNRRGGPMFVPVDANLGRFGPLWYPHSPVVTELDPVMERGRECLSVVAFAILAHH